MQRLADGFTLVDRAWFVAALSSAGWRMTAERQRDLPAGKAFWAATFTR